MMRGRCNMFPGVRSLHREELDQFKPTPPPLRRNTLLLSRIKKKYTEMYTTKTTHLKSFPPSFVYFGCQETDDGRKEERK